jgi:gamma-glutamyltranspeptidase/glutathione hydrolase
VLNLLERYPLGANGYGAGEPATVHLILEALKLAFADRARYMADPVDAEIPVGRLLSKEYAASLQIDHERAAPTVAAARGAEPNHTTHCTAVDEDGMVVAATQTVHGHFGSKVTAAGTGMLLNNLMRLMDPVPADPTRSHPESASCRA